MRIKEFKKIKELLPVLIISMSQYWVKNPGKRIHWASAFIMVREWILLNVAFCTIMEKSRQKEAQLRDCGLLLSNDLKWFFIVHSTIDSTIHSRPLYSFAHCICTTSTTNILPGRDLDPLPLSFEWRGIEVLTGQKIKQDVKDSHKP